MKQIELIEKRKPREKHFLQQDGTIKVYLYNDDVHYLKNGKYEEIDNSLIKKNNKLYNKSNSYKVSFEEQVKKEIMCYEKDGHYFKMSLVNNNITRSRSSISKSKLHKNISYENIFNNVDLNYEIMSNKVKESIVLKSIKSIKSELEFIIKTDLNLELLSDGSILATYNSEKVFIIEKPFMVDANGNLNNKISYNLKESNDKYSLELNLDMEWMKAAKFPIKIDPTIYSGTGNLNSYSTFINSGNVDANYTISDELRVGVDSVGNTYRTLLKFELPTIETGDQIIHAQLDLSGYPIQGLSFLYDPDLMTVHRITQAWQENLATWRTMNDKYDNYAEACFEGRRTIDIINNGQPVETTISSVEITNIVKKWYTDTDNYGIMLKAYKEVYNGNFVPSFCSKNYSSDVKPILSITYRNQNGVEEYMKYIKTDFSVGDSNVNIYNGNLNCHFNIGKTITGVFPAFLDLYYNTNDVLLNNNVYGNGINFSLSQTIIYNANNDFLEYTDCDGTIHYLHPTKQIFDNDTVEVISEENTYYDDEGLDLVVKKYTNYYTMTDKSNSTLRFDVNNNTGFLTSITNSSGKTMTVYYNSGKISKVVDANNNEINITYSSNQINVVSANQTVILNYDNSNKLISLINKLGTIYFNYNSDNLIDNIIDVNGKKTRFEYYTYSPFRIRKITEYGINNGIGNCFEFTYSFDATTIIDSDGRIFTYTFNEIGNAVSNVYYKNRNSIKNAFGQISMYGTDFQFKNKLISCESFKKYVRNLISDSSFEGNTNDFICDQGAHTTICNTISRSGKNSLLATNDIGGCSIHKYISVSRGQFYTFSAYFKNDFKFILSLDYNGNTLESNNLISRKVINYNLDFTRYDVSIYVEEDGINDDAQLEIKITFDNSGDDLYIDDMQLEVGDTYGPYNMLDNSDFSDGFTGWHRMGTYDNLGNEIPNNDNYEIVNLNDGLKACKIIMEPDTPTGISKIFDINGKKDDIYTLSFWYKNEGPNDKLSFNFNSVLLNYLVKELEYDYDIEDYVEVYNPHCAIPSDNMNGNKDEWQYFSESFVADNDFEQMELTIFQQFKINNLYITNICLYKDEPEISFDYNNAGNIVSCNGTDNDNISYIYDSNNELVKKITSEGSVFKYEYDNLSKNKVLSRTTTNGITNSLIYDANDNLICTRVTNSGILTSGERYAIRLKGSNLFIRLIGKICDLSSDDHGHDLWIITQNGDYYTISNCINGMFLSRNNNVIEAYPTYQGDNSLFLLSENDNGSYVIKAKGTDLCLKNDSGSIVLQTLDEGNSDFQFYFDKKTKMFIENNAEYTSNGKYLKKTTDYRLIDKKYTFNQTNGLLEKTIDVNGNETCYEYNNKGLLSSIITGNNSIQYNYNNQNKVSSINAGNKSYYFEYDEFLRRKKVKVNDITLITNNYSSNNGNLSSVQYGNGNVVQFSYDEFDRINQYSKSNNLFKYSYDQNGNLQKILSNDLCERFYYNKSGKIKSHSINNDFYSTYDYDNNNNLCHKRYSLLNNDMHVYNQYNSDNKLTEVNNNGSLYTYSYDGLGRLSRKSINGLNIDYSYVTNGNRTSLVLKTIRNNNDLISYSYDKIGHVTKIYVNGVLHHRYFYDKNSQLTRENDYINNETIRYNYDNYGNILNKRTYVLNTYQLLDEDKYEYGNSNWSDLLTKFNNESVTYDAIGNPIVIGNRTLTWNNGRELTSITLNNKTISYNYDSNGYRNRKNVDGITTDYVLEGKKIIFEKHDDSFLYFMYNDIDGVDGFEYHHYDDFGQPVSEKYFYLKNIHNDIIGIIDENNNVLCRYIYDSFGNTLSIVDGNNNSIYDVDSIAYINPFRYRSYYYDVETDLYYLNSRFYNPQWGRFINADGYISDTCNLVDSNLYAYCGNDYINKVDKNGTFGWLIVAVVAIAIIGTGCSREAPTEDIGAAPPYINIKGNGDNSTDNPNCYAYAVGYPKDLQPGQMSNTTENVIIDDVQSIGKAVQKDMKAMGRSVRVVDGPNAKVYKNEYKIALRTGTRPLVFEDGSFAFDYHFMRQTDTGQWAEKHGRGGDTHLWDYGLTPDEVVWSIDGVHPYYDSEIIYFAISAN